MDKMNCRIYNYNKDPRGIQYMRPISLINIIYKLWDVVYVNRPTPYANLIAKETQAGYANRRSEIDIPSIVRNQVRNEETKHLLHIDLSMAIGLPYRNTLWTIAYEKGFHGMPTNK